MRPTGITAMVLGGFVAACAPTHTPGTAGPDRAARPCFLVSQVRSFNDGERDESIIVQTGRQSFELTALGVCWDIDWANQVAIVPFGGASSLCVGDQADLVIRPLGGDVQRCRIRVSRALSEAEPADD